MAKIEFNKIGGPKFKNDSINNQKTKGSHKQTVNQRSDSINSSFGSGVKLPPKLGAAVSMQSMQVMGDLSSATLSHKGQATFKNKKAQGMVDEGGL
jgi:hypothetical protein